MPPWGVAVVVATSYACGSLFSFGLLHATVGAVLFPPAGISFAALVVTNKGRWPLILAVVGTTELVVDLSQGQRLGAALGFVLANTLEPLVGAWLFRRFFDTFNVRHRRDLVGFLVFGVLAGPLAGSLIGATTILLGFRRGWVGAFLSFWSGDALGVLAVGGIILAWKQYQHYSPPRWTTSTSVAVLATVLATVVGYLPSTVPLFYLPMPLLFFLAFRGGAPTVAAAGLAMIVTANLMSAAGHGPWGADGSPTRPDISTLQAFLGIALVGAWMLAIEIAEHEHFQSVSHTESVGRLRAESLQGLTARLTMAATTEAVCRVILDHGITLIADHGVAGVLTSEATELRTWTTAGFPHDIAARYHRLPIDAVVPIAQAAHRGRVEVAQTLDELRVSFPAAVATYEATGAKSCLSVPIRSRDEVIGALSFGFDREETIDPDTIAFAETVADLAGKAIDRARRFEREYEAAHQLQQALLPVIDSPPGVVAVARYVPANADHDVGGDWYDVFPLPGGRVGFAVGDVVGHDLNAAVAMSRLQTALRALASNAAGPAAVLEQLDRLVPSIPHAFMTTIAYGDFQPATGRLRFANAGHMPFLLVKDRNSTFLWDGRSLPLGVATNPRPEAELTVNSGNVLIGFTDGLVERRNEPIDVGLNRLTALVSDLRDTNLHSWCDSIIAGLVGDDARDDTALLCARFETTVSHH